MAREDGFFDDLARGLADGSLTRGKALRLMGAAVVGGTLGSLGIGAEAEADDLCKPTGKKCNKAKQCCSRNCSGGTCAACPSGQVLCGGSCVSNGCPTGQTFNSSTCQCECPSGQVLCGGSCVSTSCPEGQILNTTTCQCECPSGQVLCNGSCGLPNFSTHCTADTQCCSGACGFQGPGPNSSCVPCRDAGGPCTANSQCCSNSLNGGTCVNGRCCAPAGQSCTDTKPCCPGSSCFNGVCRS